MHVAEWEERIGINQPRTAQTSFAGETGTAGRIGSWGPAIRRVLGGGSSGSRSRCLDSVPKGEHCLLFSPADTRLEFQAYQSQGQSPEDGRGKDYPIRLLGIVHVFTEPRKNQNKSCTIV